MAPALNADVLLAARILWDYLKLNQALMKSDCIIAMGSHDLRVAQYAAELMVAGWAPLLVCSGGLGRLTRNLWQGTEAQKFADAAQDAGVPAETILLETRSTNTGENIRFTRALLEEKGYQIHSALLVHKPYMERRAFATARNYWPEISFTVTSPPIPFESYATEEIPAEMMIEAMVGDFERVRLYAQKGYQIHQIIPQKANAAFDLLRRSGFTRFLEVE